MPQEPGTVMHLGTADAVRRVVAAGDDDQVVALLAASPVLAWFALPPHELRSILTALPAEKRSAGPLAGLGLMLHAGSPQPAPADLGPRTAAINLGTDYFQLRMQGAPQAALRQLADPETATRTSSALFDTTGGMEGLFEVQSGITLMLSGSLHQALAAFTRVQLNPPPELPFLLRDAHVKSALIHAQFGDPRQARQALDAAAALPRTDSWVEPGIDAHAEIAEILLLPMGTPDLVDRVNAIPLASVGELWPYYVLALHTAYARAGRHRDGASRVELLRNAAPPRRPRDGFPGSVFEILLAEDALLRGDPAVARTLLAEADPALFATRLVAALFDCTVGDLDAAIQRLTSLQNTTTGLRQLDVRRLVLLATVLYRSGDVDACVGVLRQLHGVHGGLSEGERRQLPAELWPLARERVAGWPALPPGVVPIDLPQPRGRLTTREREVLACMAAGQSREQIAATLFISVNTVKTHQRLLFRKLGASNRAEALVEAAHRGLI